MPAKGPHIFRRETCRRGGLLDNQLHLSRTPGAINGLSLINAAKEWRNVGPAPREPRADHVSRAHRAERDPPRAERVSLAAADRYPQRVILPKFDIAGL